MGRSDPELNGSAHSPSSGRRGSSTPRRPLLVEAGQRRRHGQGLEAFARVGPCRGEALGPPVRLGFSSV